MPNVRVHDGIGLVVCCLAAVPIFSWLPFSVALAGTVGFVFATYMFNGDLDLYSAPYQRWWILRWLWYPYRRFLPHRSVLSHGPVIGTVMRLSYLCLILVGPALLACHLAGIDLAGLRSRAEGNRSTLIAALAGIEVGSLVHTISDVVSTWSKRIV